MFKKILEDRKTPFIFVALMFLAAMSQASLMTYADDAYLSTVLKSPSEAFAYAWDQYMTWSCRLSSNILAPIIMRENIWIWRVLNTGAFTLLIFGMYRISARNILNDNFKKRWLIVGFIFCAIFFAGLRTMKWGAFWVTGSFSYLWFVAFMVFILYSSFKLFDGEDVPKNRALLYIPFALYCSFHEQVGSILLCFMLISLIYYYIIYRKISVAVLVTAIIVFICLVMTFIAPGNSIRFESEVAEWYPAFAEMTLGEKVFHGFSYTVLFNFLMGNSIITILLFIFIIYLLYKQKQALWIRIIAFLPIIYIICGSVYRIVDKDLFNVSRLFNFMGIALEIQSAISVEIITYTSFYIGVVIILIIPFLFYKLFGKSVLFMECFLLYSSALMSSFILSFSPTILGSGERIFFAGNVMLVILVARLLTEVLNKSRIKILN